MYFLQLVITLYFPVMKGNCNAAGVESSKQCKTFSVCQITKKKPVIIPRDFLSLYPGGKLRGKLGGGVSLTS